MSALQNSIAETADSASAAAAARADSAPPSASAPQPTETSNANESQNQCHPPRERHHRRQHNSGDMMLTAAAAAALQTEGENALGIVTATAPYGFTNSSPVATLRAEEDSRGGSTTTTTTTMAAHYDSFADEYWFRVHNQAMRVQREHQRPPPRETAEERVREARRAYTGLTDMLQRLRSNSPEEK